MFQTLALRRKKGFTLIELLVVIGIIAILAAVVLIAINPGRQFAQARNSQRSSDINSILNALHQCGIDQNGDFSWVLVGDASLNKALPCATGTKIEPDYISVFPVDPRITNGDYQVTVAGTRLTVSAPSGELSGVPPVTR